MIALKALLPLPHHCSTTDDEELVSIDGSSDLRLILGHFTQDSQLLHDTFANEVAIATTAIQEEGEDNNELNESVETFDTLPSPIRNSPEVNLSFDSFPSTPSPLQLTMRQFSTSSPKNGLSYLQSTLQTVKLPCRR